MTAVQKELVDDVGELLDELIELMVAQPTKIERNTEIVEEAVSRAVYHIHVASGDLGKVVGKQGRIVRALRLILLSVGRKAGVTLDLDVEGGK